MVGEGRSCILCQRAGVTQVEGRNLCEYHAAARENLLRAYEGWRRAFDELGWREYLERVIRLPETGVWAKEVAELELKRPQRGEP